ncbi:class IIb bacteriocin, lactobin A/cerein 7B family [Sphingobacterium sp. NGMCC 1.201703]|uniref:class IIb bacteriocin, lactobin A/cerein 7B family n=1 Tax=Sphingobacterium sp. NGMCC 1.201703 TaxID=3388657 RepID=UPI0039FCD6EC
MKDLEIYVELSNEELLNVEGGILPVIAAGAILKGIGIGFGAVAAGVGLVAAAKELFS